MKTFEEFLKDHLRFAGITPEDAHRRAFTRYVDEVLVPYMQRKIDPPMMVPGEMYLVEGDIDKWVNIPGIVRSPVEYPSAMQARYEDRIKGLEAYRDSWKKFAVKEELERLNQSRLRAGAEREASRLRTILKNARTKRDEAISGLHGEAVDHLKTQHELELAKDSLKSSKLLVAEEIERVREAKEKIDKLKLSIHDLCSVSENLHHKTTMRIFTRSYIIRLIKEARDLIK